MGNSKKQRNQQLRQLTAPYPGPNSQQTQASSSSQTNISKGTSANRSAKSPPPTKKLRSGKEIVISAKTLGKLPVELTGIDLEDSITRDTYASSTTPPLDASKDASQQQISPENPLVEIDMQDVNQTPIPDKEVALTEITKKKSLFAAIRMDTIKGKSRSAKVELLQKTFFHLNSFSGVKQREIKKVHYLAIELLNQDDLQTAINTPVPTPADDNPDKTSTLQIWEEIKPPASVDLIQEQNNRTIQVIDIPLNVTGKMVTAAFKRYGVIEKLTMRTRNLFQQAFIRYNDANAIQPFMEEHWCTFISKDCVRVLPLKLTAEQRLNRQEFCHKLAGIPRNCKAGHLVDFLKSINAKSCFIPRNLNTYRQQNFAFVNFLNKEDFDRAPLTSYSFEKSRLFWCDQKAKTCFSCGSPNHSVKACPV